MNVVSAGTLVGRPLAEVDDGCRKQIDLVLAVLQREARCIKRSRRVGPVEMTDQSLFAENQFLTSDSKKDRRSFGLSELDVRLAYVHRVFERRCIGLGVLSEDLRVLRLNLKAHPVGRTHAHVESHAIERIRIARVGVESAAVESFDAHPVLAAESEPGGQMSC